MTRRLLAEGGFTLVEVLVTMTLMMIVLGATLTTFTNFEQTNLRNGRQNEAQDEARRSMDSLARELRNLASPTDELPQAVDRAEPQDLIFQSTGGTRAADSFNDRNSRRLRYCLDASGALWRQEQRWKTAVAPPVPSDTQCPGTVSATGWRSKGLVEATELVNAERPVFSYNAASLTSITEVTVSLFVDVDPKQSPKEVTLENTIFLRNQNRAPEASFTANVSGTAIVLNGSESRDPEEKELDFYWYDETRSDNQCGSPLPSGIPTAGCIGTGIVMTYTPTAGTRGLHLIVRDPAGLTNTADSQTVCVPGAGVIC
jgi:type II secretory pathway pseudopilin PulG